MENAEEAESKVVHHAHIFRPHGCADRSVHQDTLVRINGMFQLDLDEHSRFAQVDEILGGFNGERDRGDPRPGRSVPLIPLGIKLELEVRNGEKHEGVRCCHLSRQGEMNHPFGLRFLLFFTRRPLRPKYHGTCVRPSWSGGVQIVPPL